MDSLLWLWGLAVAMAAGPTPRAENRAEYMGRPIAQTMHASGAAWLTRDSREAEERSSELLTALALSPGMTVCDLGAGSGFHVLPIARLVGPKGRVLAVDVQPAMLDLLTARVKEARLANVTAILGTPTDPKLGARVCDLVLVVDVYHELSEPGLMLKHLLAALTPRGRVVLVEFRAEDPKVPIKREHKMSKAQVLRELAANGFVLDRSYDRLPWQHVLFFAPAIRSRP